MFCCRPWAELSLSSNNPVTWNILWSQKAAYSPCTNATQSLGRDPLSSSRERCEITITSWLVSPNLLLHQSESICIIICIIISSQNFIASVLILKTTEIFKKLRYLQGREKCFKTEKKSFKTEKKITFLKACAQCHTKGYLIHNLQRFITLPKTET